MQLISIFQRLSQIYREFVWKALISPINWSTLTLKIQHLTKCTLCLKYFRNIAIVMTKGKIKKSEITKIYLFLLPPLPSQDGGIVATPSFPQLFSRQEFSNFFFIKRWVSGQRAGKLTEWQY